MERDENFRIFGVRDSLLNITTRVACDLAAGRTNDLTRRWTKWHKAQDKRRREQEARDNRERAAAREIAAAVKSIKKKHGV